MSFFLIRMSKLVCMSMHDSTEDLGIILRLLLYPSLSLSLSSLVASLYNSWKERWRYWRGSTIQVSYNWKLCMRLQRSVWYIIPSYVICNSYSMYVCTDGRLLCLCFTLPDFLMSVCCLTYHRVGFTFQVTAQTCRFNNRSRELVLSWEASPSSWYGKWSLSFLKRLSSSLEAIILCHYKLSFQERLSSSLEVNHFVTSFCAIINCSFKRGCPLLWKSIILWHHFVTL